MELVRGLLRWILRFLLGTLACLFLVIIVVSFFKIPIDLTRFKQPIESLVSKSLQRPAVIEKSIVITTSLSPVFTLEGLRIAEEVKKGSNTFLYLDLARLQLELLPLLQKKVHLAEITAKGLELNLEEREDGSVNWITASEKESTQLQEKPQDSSKKKVKSNTSISSDAIVVKKLLFNNLRLNYKNPEHEEPVPYEITTCSGEMVPGQPLNLKLQGSLQAIPYEIDLKVASLEELLLHKKSWMDINFDIAETILSIGGNVNLAEAHKSVTLQASISGTDFSSLDELLKLELPPLNNYQAKATLFHTKDHLELKELYIKTGSSELNGSAKIVRSSNKYISEIELHSPLIQLDDFTFDDWTWSDNTTKDESEKVTEQSPQVEEPVEKSDDKKGNRKLLSPESLALVDVIVSIRAEQVLSGDDDLGNGYINGLVRDGRIAIDPLELNIPGGAIHFDASLKPGAVSSDASMALRIDNFDIGILIRRTKPDSDMGGLINVDAELKASATSMDQLMARGNGHFDFSGQLTNMKAGIIDIWAVNLIATIVSSTDENQSKINCAIGRWGVEDGLLVPDVFLVDTSKIRICGAGRVNFKNQNLKLNVTPVAKKAEFFSLATPIRVSGSFNDIGFGIKRGGLVGTALRFITSPVITPLKRIVQDALPEDGSDVCSMQIGPENRVDLEVPGCD